MVEKINLEYEKEEPNYIRLIAFPPSDEGMVRLCQEISFEVKTIAKE